MIHTFENPDMDPENNDLEEEFSVELCGFLMSMLVSLIRTKNDEV